MKLLDTIKLQCLTCKCFGLLHLKWTSHGHFSKTHVNDRVLIFASIVFALAMEVFLWVVLLSMFFTTPKQLGQIARQESQIGLILSTFFMVSEVTSYGVLVIFNAARRDKHLAYYKLLFDTEKELVCFVGQIAGNRTDFGTLALLTFNALLSFFYIMYDSLRDFDILTLISIPHHFSQKGLHMIKLNVLLQLLVINRRYSHLSTVICTRDRFAKINSLHQAYQDCLKLLRELYGVPLLLIFLDDFLKILRTTYTLVLNGILVANKAYFTGIPWWTFTTALTPALELIFICHTSSSLISMLLKGIIMKLSTILKCSTTLAKCFGYFPLRWNGQTVSRYGSMGDKLVCLATLAYGTVFSYWALEMLTQNMQNFSVMKDAINAQSLVGLVFQILEFFVRILVTNAEMILSVAYRGRQMEFINLVLMAEQNFTRSISTDAADARLLGVFTVGGGAIALMFLHFQVQVVSQPAFDLWYKLFMNFFTWSSFGVFVFQLNLLLHLVALNQRFDLMIEKIGNSNEKKFELFSTLQVCVAKLNQQYGLQFGWILLSAFMSTLASFYQFVLNLVLREVAFDWLTLMVRNCLCIIFLSAICWSAGQLSEKAKRVVDQQTQFIYYSQPTDQWSKATKLNLTNLHKPKLEVISASGYFTIDRTVIFSFFSTLTLYILVMCQFKMEEDS